MYYIAHAWDLPFGDLVAAIKAHYEGLMWGAMSADDAARFRGFMLSRRDEWYTGYQVRRASLRRQGLHFACPGCARPCVVRHVLYLTSDALCPWQQHPCSMAGMSWFRPSHGLLVLTRFCFALCADPCVLLGGRAGPAADRYQLPG